MDTLHVPNVTEKEGLIGLLMFCAIMELSNVLHPGSYEPGKPMKQLERANLIEGRKYTRMIISWFRASFVVTTSIPQNDIFEEILWRMTMTLAYSMNKNKFCLKPIIEECTPDAVACLMYDSLKDSQFSGPWERRSEFITDRFDWDWPHLDIKAKNGIIVLPAGKEDGLTAYDTGMLEKNGMELPSLGDRVDMDMWLQKSGKKRMMQGEQSQPTGEQSFSLTKLIYKSKSGMRSKKRRN